MKKLVISVVVLAAVAALAMPYWVGAATEDRLGAHLEEASKDGYLQAELTDFQRGWLDSSGSFEVRMSDEYREALFSAMSEPSDDVEAFLRDGELTFDFTVSHGPVIMGAEPHLGFSATTLRLRPPSDAVERWMEEANLPYLLEARIKTGFDGTSTVSGDVPSVQHVLEDDVKLNFSGLSFEGAYDPSAGHVLSAAKMDRLELSQGDKVVRVENVVADGDNVIVGRRFMTGAVNAGIGRLLVEDPADAARSLDVRDVSMSSRVEPRDQQDLVNVSVSYGVGSLSVADVEVTDARFNVAVSPVNVATFEAYNDFTRSALLAEGSADPAAAQQAMMDLAYGFLKEGPEVNFDPVAVTYNGQPVRLTLKVAVDESALPPRDALQAAGPAIWDRLVTAEGRLEAAQGLVRTVAVANMKDTARAMLTQQGGDPTDDQVSLVAGQQADMMLAALTAQGLVIADGERYRSDLLLKGGQLTVNGQPMPIPGLQ